VQAGQHGQNLDTTVHKGGSLARDHAPALALFTLMNVFQKLSRPKA
jgi:hypothetical protein